SLETLLDSLLVTQILPPSKATPPGPDPTAKVPRTAPSVARIFVTVLLLELAIHMEVPSKAIPCGAMPTEKLVVRFAGYHRNIAIASRFGAAVVAAASNLGSPGPCTESCACR